jgi:hypothetical protein
MMDIDATLQHLSEVLSPIKVVVWGEVAMAELGVPTGCQVCHNNEACILLLTQSPIALHVYTI